MNATELGKDYPVVVLVSAKCGPHCHEQICRKMAAIPGVWAVYYILGDNDFVLLRADYRQDYMHVLEKISSMPDIERTSIQVVRKSSKKTENHTRRQG